MKKIVLAFITVAVMCFGLSQAMAFKPAVVFDMGGKFDKSFNEGIWNGTEKFRKETGIKYREFEVQLEAQREQFLRKLAQRGSDIVIAVGFMDRLKDEADSELVGHEAFSDLLTYLGYPQFDVDYGKGNFPQEASLGDHISFNKGCYVGQEPHARMYHRGHPNWVLVRLTFPKDVDVKPGTELFAEGESAGTLTSLSSIHDEEVKKGIGMIRHQLSLSGTVLNLKENSTILIRQEALTYQI